MKTNLYQTYCYCRQVCEYKDGEIIFKDKQRIKRIDKDVYVRYKIKGALIPAHRLVWFLCKGFLPSVLSIDHKNCNRADNRIENLRLATQRMQCLNRNKVNRDTGVKGIYLDKTKGLRAIYATRIFGKMKRFHSLELAQKAREVAYGKNFI